MMKKITLFYLLLAIISSPSCTDEPEMHRFTISARDVANNSIVKGGVYKISDAQSNVVSTHTLHDGILEISNLPKENGYVIEEISPPAGYVCKQKVKQIHDLKQKSKELVFHYINENNRDLPDYENVTLYSSIHSLYLGDYKGVKIGEYYWMDQNMTGVVPAGIEFENSHPITQQLLNRYVERIRINPTQYQLNNISDFEKYYGRYYSYPSILYLNQYGVMKDEYNQVVDGWGLPAAEDYRQLFAMTPFNTSHDGTHTSLNERDVRFALGAKEGDNPMAFDIQEPGSSIYKTYWFTPQHTTNMYKFNLMPGGARLNGPGKWCNGLGPNSGCYNDGVRGDIYHLFYTACLATKYPNDPYAVSAVTIHSNIETKEKITYHLLNVRWCRRLTDIELGYKLYINKEQTDIKKLSPEAPTPEGYKELPHGYTRGFYVQYILNNPNPNISVKDIINYARNVDDNYVKENRNNKNIIF